MNTTETSARAQAAALLPIYSADTFGVCSALFELGGMVVIHDPSGCNSTYTTHDEPRWYDHDSLIFISALTEYDAILGRDDKLIRDVEAAANEFHPRFLCLIPSQIAALISTDLAAVCRIIERDTGIPAFTLPTNSMQSYDAGIRYAMEQLARHVIRHAKETTHASRKRSSSKPRVNLLGLTPLDFAWKTIAPSLKTFLEMHGFGLGASWTLGSTLDEIEMSANADVNLILTKSTIPAAQLLKKGLGIPYIAAVPYPPIADDVATTLWNVTEAKNSPDLRHNNRRNSYDLPSTPAPPRIRSAPLPKGEASFSRILIGEHLASFSLAKALERSLHQSFHVLTPPFDESTLQASLSHASLILADPLYQALAPASAHFIPLPHRACSGRTYEKEERNLLDPVEWAALLAEIEPYI